MTAQPRPHLTLADLADEKDWLAGFHMGAETHHNDESDYQRNLGNHRLADYHTQRAAEYRHQKEAENNE